MPGFLKTTLLCRCPACGKGPVFSSLLQVADSCAQCSLNFKAHEQGDGPTFFAITVVGFVVTLAAVIVELAYQPPFWGHAALWGPLIVVLSLTLLRVFKAGLIGMQYRTIGLR